MSGRRRSTLALVLGVAVAAALWAGWTAPAGAGSPSTTAAPTTAAPTTAAPTTAAPTTARPTTTFRPAPTTPRTTARPATTTTPPTTAPTTVSTDTTLPTTETTDTTDTTTTSTTAPTTTSPPATVAPEERVQADTPGDKAQQRLRLVIWALLGLAAVSLVSTLVFWRLTRPRPEEDAPAMRWAAPGDPTVAEAAPVLVGAAAGAAATVGDGVDPVTEPHPVVTVPSAPADPFAAPPPVVNNLPPGPQVPAEPVVDAAAAGAVAGAVAAGTAAGAAEVLVPSEVLDPSAEFEAEDASVPPATPDPGPPTVAADGMWASAGWGQDPAPAAAPSEPASATEPAADPAPAPAPALAPEPAPAAEPAAPPVPDPAPAADPAPSAPFDFDAPFDGGADPDAQ